ncbi:MAG: hypothetical protein A3C84_04620 [Candidatus Ryanbacteria bacterium RIFCSPHIGHO2_02_FULL_48_12]|uniref:DUF4314 domain-containing protein n=1 Tax=Candidatus Ryanbacteria bacterium RIFCSPHIGHO2_01_FULL_48_27 TaxID=1802115 RepID=A0A1G2G674_9BACT|nr:MAG: hypothetical protein A2756_02180 [Candidatus Ryanbacteria bacterium RIFCSPHIGHO2_01_FULL_48_27]OGZ49863.1 MAG: hypothetical protein A3C84_04620 [Candidatus Ryanbacteria bacterium RIFCSPHIGHO2_02_FULL_48_12]
MIDRSHSGFRVHTLRFVRTVKGDLSPGTQGTIVYETESLGRQLVLIDWDAGFSVPAFPDEIEIEDRKDEVQDGRPA